MEDLKQKLSEQQLEQIVGNLLRWGVILAASVVVVGGGLYLQRHGMSYPDYRTFRGEPAELRSVSQIITGAFALQGRAVMQLGLLLLIATPVTRVAFAVFAFAFQGDRLYVVVTLIVLSVLLYSLIGGYL